MNRAAWYILYPRGPSHGTDRRHLELQALAGELAREIRASVREVTPLEAVVKNRRE